MIKVSFYIANGDIIGFNADNHGDKIVCAAVSALVINTVNSIECLTDSKFHCNYKDEKFIEFRLSEKADASTKLLLDSLRMGLNSIAEEHPDDMTVNEVYVR